MLKLKRRGPKGIWQIRGSLGGKRYRESTGTDSEAHAKVILTTRQAEILDRLTWGEAKTTTFAEAVEHYLDQGGEARFLGPIVKAWGNRRIADITSRDVAQLASQLHPNGSAAYRDRSVYTPISAVIRAAVEAEMCEPRAIKRPKIKQKPVKYANDDWFARVMPHCNVRLAATILFLTYTGCRAQEACNVAPGDVNLGTEEVTLRETKNGTARRVKLAPILLDALSRLEPVKGTREIAGELVEGLWVLGYASRWSINKALQRACKRAGVPYLSTHKIGRHAFAARLLAEGHSLKLVQEAGGWKVIRMVSQHYGHLEHSQMDAAVAGAGTKLAQALGPLIPKQRQALDLIGGRDRDRTCDPYHVKVVLYR
jgi:integrase